MARAPWRTHRPPPAVAGSVVNRCGGGWSAVADAPSAPARANDPHTHLSRRWAAEAGRRAVQARRSGPGSTSGDDLELDDDQLTDDPRGAAWRSAPEVRSVPDSSSNTARRAKRSPFEHVFRCRLAFASFAGDAAHPARSSNERPPQDPPPRQARHRPRPTPVPRGRYEPRQPARSSSTRLRSPPFTNLSAPECPARPPGPPPKPSGSAPQNGPQCAADPQAPPSTSSRLSERGTIPGQAEVPCE